MSSPSQQQQQQQQAGGGGGGRSNKQLGRFSGKAANGRLRIGAIICGNNATAQRSSIPTKFETILATAPREKDGFTRRTQRFDDQENDLPGPGTYHKPLTFVKDLTCDFSSKNGSSSFASRDTRFCDKPLPLFVVPGPGQYNPLSTNHSGGVPSSVSNSIKGSASFVGPPVLRLRDVRKNQQTPGPGAYSSPTTPKASASEQRQYSIFQSRMDRIVTKEQTETDKIPRLGPTTYADRVLKHGSVAKVALDIKERPAMIPNPLDPSNPKAPPPVTSAVFRSSSDRFGALKKRPKQLKDISSFPPVPGNDTHNADTESNANTTISAAGVSIVAPKPTPSSPSQQQSSSSMFAATTLDRFGKSTVRYTQQESELPGPGYYFPQKGLKKLLISSSWALSSVSRFEDPGEVRKVHAPGPAFYAPRALPRKSFLMNQNRGWVS